MNNPEKNTVHQTREQLLLSQTEALANTGSWEFDIKTRMFFWSDGVYRILEHEPQSFEVTYKKAMDAIHPNDRKQAATFIEECITHGIDYLNEKRFITKTNKVKYIHSSGRVLRDKDGNPDKIIGVHQDVTSFRNFENNIQNTLTALQERIKEQTCLYKIASLSNDITSGIDDILSETVKILPIGFQYTEHVVARIRYGEMTFDTNNKKKGDYSIEAIRTGVENKDLSIAIGYEKVMPNEDEGPFLQEERQLIETIADTLILKINQTVTNNNLTASSSKNEMLLQSTEEGIYGIDENGICTFINRSGAKMLGYPADECIGKNMHKLVHYKKENGDPFQEKDCPIFKTRNSDSGCRNENDVFWRKDGNSIPVRYSSTPILQGGKSTGSVIVFNDITETKKAEMQLQSSEKRFKSLVQDGSDLIAILDLLGNYTYVSPTSFNILGIKPEEFIGKNAFDFIHEEDKPEVAHNFNMLPSVKRIEIKPFRFLDKNGNWRWIETVATNLLGDPAIGGIVVNSRDVTEKVLADQQKALIEKRFRAMVQEGSGLISIVGIDGIYKYNSPNYPYILGYETVELTGKTTWDYIHPDDVEHLRKEFSQLENEKRVKSSPYRFRHKSGKWRWLQSIATNLLTMEAVEGIVVNSVDISSLMEVQDTLKKSNERFNYLNKASRDAIYDWDVVNDNFQWGEGFKRVFGHNFGEVSEFSLADWKKLTHPDDLVEDESLNFLKNKNKTRWNKEFRFKRADGSFAYVEEIGHLIRDKKGQAIRMIGVLRDVSETKQAQIEREIQHEISLYFTEGIDLKESISKSLVLLAEFGKFAIAELWMVSTNKDYIHLQSTYARDTNFRKFYKESINVINLSKKEGFPGKVWKNGKVSLMNDIHINKSFIRKNAAFKTGLKSALGVPVVHHDNVTGVLVLCNDGPIPGINEKLNLYTSIGRFLGAEIIRKKQEEEMYLLFQSSPEILAVTSPDGRFSKVNPAFCDLLGCSEEELTTQSFTNFLHPDDRKNTLKEYKKSKKEKRVTKNFLNRYVTKAGTYKWISWSSSQIFGEEGHFFAYGHDVTEVKELQNLLNSVSQLSKVGGWELDVKKQTVFWSQITKQIHEVPDTYEPELNTAINFYKKGSSQEIIIKKIEEALQTGQSWDTELQIVTARGKEKWVRAIGNAEFIDGQCVRLFGSFQDIDKQKQPEIRLKNISDNIPGILFQYRLNPDSTDKLEHVSKGSVEIWGFSPEECEDSTEIVWKGIRDGGDFKSVMESMRESAEKFSRWNAKWRYVKPDGSLRYHEGSGNPHRLANGAIVWDSIITDITEQHDLEKIAERTAKLARVGSWEISVANDTPKKTYWSPITHEILEADPSIKPSFYKLQKNSKIMKSIKRMIMTGNDIDEELLITTSKNNHIWIRLIGQADRVGQKIVKVFGSIQDIHQRKLAELNLKQAFEEKNTILESIGDAFFAVDKNWVVTYWNKEAEKVLGKKREETVGISLWESYKDAISLDFYKEYHKAMKTGQIVHFEEYYPTTNQWFEVSAYPSEQGLSVYFKDVSIRKIAEDQIKKTNERFEKVSKATNDSIWDWDIIRNNLYQGEGYKTQFGYDIVKLESKNLLQHWSDNLHLDDMDEVLSSLNNAIENPKISSWHKEYRFKKSNGQYAFVKDRGLIMRDSTGKATRMVGAMSDITYQKEYEKSLKKLNLQLERHARELALSNEELEQFAYVASHDLQEPLRMVTSFLTQLEKKYGHQFDEKAHQYIHFAVDGAKRMRQIILDLLEFSRVGKNEEEILVDININELLTEIIKLHRRTMEEKNAQVIFTDLPVITAYKTPIRQIFQNLIGNALKYSRDGVPPKILVKAKEFKFQWHFTIMDNGIGIEEEYFEKIFILFQRLHNKEAYSGTGMGLSIVKKILDNIGGQIWVDSKPGAGSTFHFTIPKKENMKMDRSLRV